MESSIMARRIPKPRHDTSFHLRLSTMLIIVAIVTHSHLGLDVLLWVADFFNSDPLKEGLTAFSRMTDRLLVIAMVSALFFGVMAFRKREYSTQYWLEMGFALALIALMNGPAP
jgi:hypothetical protein